MKIELRDVCKSYGRVPILQKVSLEIRPNEMFFLLGPSGCGKTTLLRMVAGFAAPDSGEILFDGRRVNDAPAERRGTPMVFQSYALWPHMTVFENVAYGSRLKKLSESEIQKRTKAALEAVRMRDFAHRTPNQLSGGQQQRAAMARALAVDPSALLFDEPLSNLDARLRIEMRQELVDLHRRRPFTAVYVTHDQEEAMTMAARIAVMEQGKIHQVGTPREIYTRPANRFVAEFMGAMNWIPSDAPKDEDDSMARLETPIGILRARRPEHPPSPGSKTLVGFRPWAGALRKAGETAGVNVIPCRVAQAHYAGSSWRLMLKPVQNESLRFQIQETRPSLTWNEGETVSLSLPPEEIMILAEPLNP